MIWFEGNLDFRDPSSERKPSAFWQKKRSFMQNLKTYFQKYGKLEKRSSRIWKLENCKLFQMNGSRRRWYKTNRVWDCVLVVWPCTWGGEETSLLVTPDGKTCGDSLEDCWPAFFKMLLEVLEVEEAGEVSSMKVWATYEEDAFSPLLTPPGDKTVDNLGNIKRHIKFRESDL